MSTEGVIMQDTISCGSAPGSPLNKMKFLCSHGGKILPRPADGHLRYVGGETRVISVPREIKFPADSVYAFYLLKELMKKLTDRVEGEMVLKYQLVPEDLDSLVSVKSDEDLRHMFDEYDRHETEGTARLRAFLFPACPVVLENHMETDALEQRYIDALNGIVRVSAPATKQHPVFNTSHGGAIGISSSACTSPRSPESCLTDAIPQDPMLQNNYLSSRNHIPRNHSSPSICNLNGPQQSSPYSHVHPHNHYQISRTPPYQGYHPSSKPPIDPYRGPERLISVRSVGRTEGIRYQMDNAPPYYVPHCKHTRGNGYCSKCMNFDEYGSWSDRRMDRAAGLSLSPLSMSPRSNIVTKPWESAIAQDS